MSSPQPGAGDHYFTTNPGAPSRRGEVELVLPEGRALRLVTDRGVFSPERVDPGTRALLVDGPAVRPGGTLADLGCGYGAIAITLALRGGPDTVVWAIDVNDRARDLCQENAARHGVADQVRVVPPDGVPADLRLDQLWSNPPIRVGKVVLHELLTTWLGRLASDGEAALVVHKHLGADSLVTWLGTRGWASDRLASRSGYRILRVAARPDTTPSDTTPPDTTPSADGAP